MQQSISKRLMLIWTAILATVAGAMWMQSLEEPLPPDADAAEQVVAPVDPQAELVGKTVMLLEHLRSYSPTATSAMVMQNAAVLDEPGSPFADRLGHAVLVGEVESWEAGIEKAKGLEPANDAEGDLRDSLVAVLEERAAAGATGDGQVAGEVAVDEAARETVLAKLGYFGRIACAMPGVEAEAIRAGTVILAAIVWYVAAFCIGCVVLVITLVALFRAAPASPADAPDRTQVALILGETFAVWMVLFFLMNLGAGLLGQAIVEASGLQDTPTAVHVGLACGAVGFFGSLVALFWARLRGVSGAVVREALGLHAGRGVLREAMQGVLCYLAAVPLLVAGLIVFVILTAIVHAIFGPPKAPSHPVAELFADADALRIALIALVATVAAPVVEEIMFRGALYGHLRTTVFARHRILSVLVAAGVSSFIFAVIHPQGVLFTPALGGLAVSFCLYREARGSLIAPMVAHGIQNGVTLTMGLMLMS